TWCSRGFRRKSTRSTVAGTRRRSRPWPPVSLQDSRPRWEIGHTRNTGMSTVTLALLPGMTSTWGRKTDEADDSGDDALGEQPRDVGIPRGGWADLRGRGARDSQR